nr:MAG TPA: tRNA N6-adenosine threonylcarbamoyltransferase [Caudoviricetes sp.]
MNVLGCPSGPGSFVSYFLTSKVENNALKVYHKYK